MAVRGKVAASAAVLLAACIAVRTGAQAPAAPAGGPAAPQGARGAGARGAGGGGGGGGQTFPAQQRPLGDSVEIARGKTIYSINCASCHGSDLRGGDMGGPNLLRAETVLRDQVGELFVPLVRGSRADKGMDAIAIPDTDVKAVAAYVHSVVATSRGQGAPPAGPPVVLNIVVGDAAAGQAYFTTKCSSCHSATGDLKGLASRLSDPMALQNFWVGGGAGGGRGGGGRGGGAGAATAREVTVTVTPATGAKVEGRLVRIDDFLVILGQSDGSTRSFRRNGEVPKVEIHDPAEPHKKLLTTYTDKDIHDVTAYLVTLK